MIQAKFLESNGNILGFKISGHAGYADYGQDIVCASVSSAVQLCANTITDGFGVSADVSAVGDCISLRLHHYDENAGVVLNMLKVHLEYLSEDFRNTIKITTTEV